MNGKLHAQKRYASRGSVVICNSSARLDPIDGRYVLENTFKFSYAYLEVNSSEDRNEACHILPGTRAQNFLHRLLSFFLIRKKLGL